MKFGMDDNNINVLRGLRSQLIEDKEVVVQRARDNERWESFKKTSEAISESIEGQDLESLASHVRKMKNLLRRPSVKKDLARLESKEKGGKEEKPEGSCKCSKCNGTIDGYRECVEGALCPDCALKDRKAPPGEKEKEKDEKKAKKGTAFPPEMVGTGGMQGGEGDMGGDGDDTGDAGSAAAPAQTAKDDSADSAVSTSKKKDKKKKKKRFDDEDKMPPKKKKKTESRLRRRRVTFNEDN